MCLGLIGLQPIHKWRELKDDIKAWPGGLLKTEAKGRWNTWKPVVDSPMAKVRANGLEPMFAVGMGS